MSLRGVLLLSTVLLLSPSSAASTGGPGSINHRFTIPSGYRDIPADLPPAFTHPSSSCGSESDGITARSAYQHSTSSCFSFCTRLIVDRFPLFKRRCGRRWAPAVSAWLLCRRECAPARAAISTASTRWYAPVPARPHVLVRVTYRGGRVSAKHLLFRPFYRKDNRVSEKRLDVLATSRAGFVPGRIRAARARAQVAIRGDSAGSRLAVAKYISER